MTMTVKQLIEKLKEYDEDLPVILDSSDDEGTVFNDVSPEDFAVCDSDYYTGQAGGNYPYKNRFFLLLN